MSGELVPFEVRRSWGRGGEISIGDFGGLATGDRQLAEKYESEVVVPTDEFNLQFFTKISK